MAQSTRARVPNIPNLFVRTYVTARGERRRRYYVRFRDWKGIDREVPAGDLLAAAKDLRNTLLSQNLNRHDFDADTAPGMTFCQWADQYLALKRTITSYDRYVLACAPLKQYFGALALRNLTASRIKGYCVARQQSTTRFGTAPSPATINRELLCLRAMLILAERDRLIDHRPHIEMLQEHNLRDRTATPEEYYRLLGAMPEHMRPVLLLMKELGLRVSEAVNLQSNQIDWQTRVIRLTAASTKTKRARILPMNDEVEQALQSLAHDQPAGRLFWHRSKPMTRHHFGDHFARVCKTLGIQGLWIHDLRGTFATEKLAAGHDRTLIRRITGHASDRAFDRYVRPDLKDLRRVVER